LLEASRFHKPGGLKPDLDDVTDVFEPDCASLKGGILFTGSPD
jgi:hypothetical protein